MKAFQVKFLAIAVLAIVVGSVERAAAQTPTPDPQPADGQARREQAQLIEHAIQDAEMAMQGAKIAAESATKFRTEFFFGDKRNHELDAKIRQASAQVRDAKDDATRAAATAELTKLMDQYFEADIRVREQELADIQARLQNLQTQLERRRQKKAEIIDLQIKVATNEADGLGFYSQPNDDRFNFNFRVPVPVMMSPSGDVLMPQPPTPPAPPTKVPASADAPPAGATIPQ